MTPWCSSGFTLCLIALCMIFLPCSLSYHGSHKSDIYESDTNWNDSDTDQKPKSATPPVLVFLVESFRWDFIYRIATLTKARSRPSHLWELLEDSTFATEGIESVFSTASRPNQYTLVTGLYPENHGIVSQNQIYDSEKMRSTNLSQENQEDSWVLKGEPIWDTLSKNWSSGNASVACYAWFGCSYANSSSTCYVHPSNQSWHHRVETAIDWLEQGIQLILVTYSEFSDIVRSEGPNSERVDEALLDIDYQIGLLIGRLKQENRYDHINLIILSDHGVTEATGENHLLPNDELPSFVSVRSRDDAIMLVEPEQGHEDTAMAYFRGCRHLTAFKKEELREEWHYKHSDRVAQIVLVADCGYSFTAGHKGASGYDSLMNDMKGTFIGHGPAFTPKATVPSSLSTVDVYGLMTHLVNVTAAPNNGSMKHFQKFLTRPYLGSALTLAAHSDDFSSFIIVIVLAMALVFGVLVVAWLCNTNNIRKSNEPDAAPEFHIESERTPLLLQNDRHLGHRALK